MNPRAWCLLAALALFPATSRAQGQEAMEPEVHAVGDTVVVEVRGPKPFRISRTRTPDRLVLDFPGPAMDGYGYYPRTKSLDFANVVALRRGQFDDDHGTHARLTLVLAKPLQYRLVWSETAGTIYLAGGNTKDDPTAAEAGAPTTASRKATPSERMAAHKDANTPHAPRERRSTPPNGGDEQSAPRAAHPAGSAQPDRAGKAALRPDSQRTAKAAKEPTPAATLSGVAASLKKNDLESANAALNQLRSQQTGEKLAPLFAQLALKETERKIDPARVERHAREALVAGYEDVKLDLSMGRALDRQKRAAEAGRWFRRATQIGTDPGRTDDNRRMAYFLWADALYRTGRPADEVLAAYEEAMEAYASAPETAWGLYQRSKLQMRLGHEAGARALAADLVRRFPSDYWASQARERLGPLASLQVEAGR